MKNYLFYISPLDIQMMIYFLTENSRSPQYDLELVYANTITMAWGMMRLIIDKCNYLIKEKMVNDNGDKFNLSGGDIEVLMYPIRVRYF